MTLQDGGAEAKKRLIINAFVEMCEYPHGHMGFYLNLCSAALTL